jgi:hypothetical protein
LGSPFTPSFQNAGKRSCGGSLKYLGTGFDDAPIGCCCKFS